MQDEVSQGQPLSDLRRSSEGEPTEAEWLEGRYREAQDEALRDVIHELADLLYRVYPVIGNDGLANEVEAAVQDARSRYPRRRADA